MKHLEVFKLNESKIFVVSFLILYLELVFIRLFPAQVTLLGFYTNFILIATFAGIGLGLMLSKYKTDLKIVFPWLFLLTSICLSINLLSVTPDADGEMALEVGFGVVPEYVVIPFVFLLLTAIFATLSQSLGKLFDKTPPLTAYKWDVLGSILGVLLITSLSFLRTNPIVWLAIAALLFLVLLKLEGINVYKYVNVFAISLLILYFGIYKESQLIRWSPYQKLTLLQTETGYRLLANNISHQFVSSELSKIELFYMFPYQILDKNNLDNVLIIGSGMGTDVAVSLANGAKQIDAVDIDPEIYRLGVEYNPVKPYQDEKVSFYNDDGRSYLKKTDKKYDVIIFALPDSLVGMGRVNMRLESFLLTKESFKDAKKHLTPGGLIVLYNYYRQPFLVDKLTLMLNEVFGRESYVLKGAAPFYPAAIMNGEALDRLKKDLPAPAPVELSPPPATDDWPFLYLQKPHLPPHYLFVLTIILALTYVLISNVLKKSLLSVINWNYFFLGVGFFVLESKSIVQFSLLFGTTWLTSSLVIVAVMISVFLATVIAVKKKINSLKPFYIALFAALSVQYVFPLDVLLSLNKSARYLLVSIITFAPVFFANIIFSYTFKNSKNNSLNFASNMFGAVIGGVLEYLALVTGYRNLVILVALCYFLAFFMPAKK